MSFFQFFIRLAIATAIFIFVLTWAVMPYFNETTELSLGFSSFFYGNTPPVGWARDLVLLSRAFWGLALISFILFPAISFFAEVETLHTNRFIAVILVMLGIGVFFISLIVHHMYSL